MTNDSGQNHIVRVLVVDDQRLMRDGIASLLEIQDAIEVVGTASNGKEAIEKALSLRPDVILMDVRMPVMDGVVATGQVHRQLPSCRILMLTTFDDEEYVIDALQAGASGYLLKDLPAPDLASAVQAVYKGIYQLDPAVGGEAALLGDPLILLPRKTVDLDPFRRLLSCPGNDCDLRKRHDETPLAETLALRPSHAGGGR